jgi:integrase
MANRCKGFTVASKVRSNGSPFWVVSGSFQGRQLRRQFNTRVEALAYAEERNTALRGGASGQAPVLTHLSTPEIRSAEVVLAQVKQSHPELDLHAVWDFYRDHAETLADSDPKQLRASLTQLKERFPGVTPSQACDWFLANYRVPKSSVTMRAALTNYLADVLRRHNGNTLSKRQWLSIGREMARAEIHFGADELLANISKSRLQEYLRATSSVHNYSNKTWNNRRGYFTTFFHYCINENWVDHNPAVLLAKYKRRELKRSTPVILRTSEARTLMTAVESLEGGRLVPFFVLCLFCGIRPDWKDGEIARVGITDVKLEEQKIKLRSDQTKTKKPREIMLQPNVVDWLRTYPIEQFPIKAVNFRKLYLRVRKQLALKHDVLRHTYCSMLVGKFRSVGDTALQAGNSENIIWADYLDLVDKTEAEAFWEIRPSRAPAVRPSSNDDGMISVD